MAHDEQFGGVGHQGGQGVCHHPALHLCALLRLGGVASIKLKGELVADDRLVSPPGEGHLNGQVGVLHQLLEAAAVLADADGQGRRQAAGIDHLVDGVQDVELLVHEPGQVLLLEQEQVTVPLHSAEHAPGARHPGIQPGVDLGVDGGSLVLRLVLHQVLIVVQQQHRHHRAAPPELVPHLAELGHVHPVGGGQEAPLPARGPDQVSVHQKAAGTEGDLGGTLVFPLHEPAGIKIRDHAAQLGVEQVLLLPCQMEKTVIGPDDVVALRPEDHHGQGGVYHGVLGGHIHVPGDVLDVLGYLPPPPAAVLPVIQPQQDHHHGLRRRQIQAEKGGCRGKQDQTDEIELKAWLKHLRHFSVQDPFLLFGAAVPPPPGGGTSYHNKKVRPSAGPSSRPIPAPCRRISAVIGDIISNPQGKNNSKPSRRGHSLGKWRNSFPKKLGRPHFSHDYPLRLEKKADIIWKYQKSRPPNQDRSI